MTTVLLADDQDLVRSGLRLVPVMDGIEATRRIVAAGVPSRVLILTTFDLDEHVFDALSPEIAEELVISMPTVKTHVRHILQKPNLRDRVQAVGTAYAAGLV